MHAVHLNATTGRIEGERMKFPARYTFNLIRDMETGEQSVQCCESTNQTVKMENMRYSDLKHFSWDSNKRVALLGCEFVISEDDLKKFFEKYAKWEVKVLPQATDPTESPSDRKEDLKE